MDILERLHSLYGREIDEELKKYLGIDVHPEFRDAVLYQVSTGGKRLRPLIALTSARACGGDYRRALPAAAIVELIHNYSLIYDDIIDEATLRRGKPTVRARYGDNAALLIGIWYREAIEEAILSTRNPPLFAREVARVIREIDEGERLDILMEYAGRRDPYFVENRLGPKLLNNWEELYNTYLRMIRLKTAALMRTSAALGALSVTDDEGCVKALSEYGENLGMAFQVLDDVLDIFGDVRKFGKEIGKDIKEHKLGNIVVVMALRELSEAEKSELLGVLGKVPVGDDDVRRAVELISRTRARENALRVAMEFAGRAEDALGRLGVNEGVEDLREILRFTVTREF
ncbi:polyprenyl synthetase family protein [Vulcanisaeta thermophila]|uniref:polyprenyl synthetase family protein n=1 Tax=Vulcanisaeta thermophila TaxID=867917 RepID=UPI000852FDB4|nr:polyprenyl synthetase family protein [Vulcanisaeta thermophila]